MIIAGHIQGGAADFIALGRPLLADPKWPIKAKEGRPEDIAPCIRCNEGCHDRGMLGNAKTGEKVVVIGGGVMAAEVGLYLAEQGKEVAFVEMLDEFMAEIGINRNAYNARLAAQNIIVHTGKLLYGVLDKAAVIIDRYGKKQELPADSIVLAAGFSPQKELRRRFEDETDLEIYAVGDCMGARMIFDAIHEGFLTARRI